MKENLIFTTDNSVHDSENKDNPKSKGNSNTIGSQSEEKKHIFSKRVVFSIFVLFLVVVIGLIVFKGEHVFSEKQSISNSDKGNKVDNNVMKTNTSQFFFKNIADGHINEAHTNLFYRLINKENIEIIKQFFDNQSYFNRDYQYFIDVCLVNFKKNNDTLSFVHKNNHIIETFKRESHYKAKIVFNIDRQPFEKMNPFDQSTLSHKNRMEVTGTYTSAYHWPTGLAVNNGQVINPAIQGWDGLLVIDQNGKMYIKNIKTLSYQFRNFRITENHSDYIDFLTIAEKEKLTIIQSHLLVNNGKLQMEKQSNRKFRRRALFQTCNGSISVYDSINKQITLWEMANMLIQKYNATEVLNLDMGPFNYCVIYTKTKQLKNFGIPPDNFVLSNVLIVDY